MDEGLIATIESFTLEARELLENEISEQLEGIYGFRPDGTFAAADKHPAIKELDEAKVTRERLEHLINDEVEAGLSAEEARRKLVREAAFTWLNRVVALEMMEERKLLKQTISKPFESNAFKIWLTQPENEADYKRYDAGELPQNTMGEGPRHIAYRHFLLWQCGELAKEVAVLFDPDNLTSRLLPRPAALKELVASMSVGALLPAWKPANEETIGWVYQFFNQEQKKQVFDGFSKGKKVTPENIAPATQLFTPRWIVKALVQNSLGRLWIEMHPDSRLREQLDYLVPLEGELPRPEMRPVKEITFLDPASGTMHFGLVAYDMFAAIYRDELANAGKPGWPTLSSVTCEDEIPAAIIANNLFGIDIDLRAVQLSALVLYIRAKTDNPKAVVRDTNLACADVLPPRETTLDAFLSKSGLERPMYAQLIKSLWTNLKDARELGSLLRLEDELDRIIEGEKRRITAKGSSVSELLPGFSAEQLKSEKGRSEFFHILYSQILNTFDYFVQESFREGVDRSYFASEGRKGFRMLQLMTQRYDVVAANPPYMSNRNMSAVMNNYLKRAYPASKSDLYAAFIDRCTELLVDGGRLALITQQSFMFISSYEKLRDKLRDQSAIEAMIHVGPRAFAQISGEVVNTTIYVLRNAPNRSAADQSVGTYFRLVRAPDAEAKLMWFEKSLTALRSGVASDLVYRFRQGDFDVIPRKPWVYWLSARLRLNFKNLPSLGSIATPASGQNTGDNFRFVRFWWEIGNTHVGRTFHTEEEAAKSNFKWMPYMKGGRFKRWYGNQEHCLNWEKSGRELKAFCVIRNKGKHWSRYLQNLSFNFKEGITYSFLTSKSFSARLSPGGFMFDYAGCSIFGADIDFLLGVLNSEIALYFLRLINPTVNFQPGDLSRLPVPRTSTPQLINAVSEAIEISRELASEDETTFEFISPPSWIEGMDGISQRFARLADLERLVNEELEPLYQLNDDDRRLIRDELRSPDEEIPESVEERSSTEDEGGSEATTETADAPPSSRHLASLWIAYAVGILLGRFQPGSESGLGRGNFPVEIAKKLLTFCDADGVAVSDQGHPDNLTFKVMRILELMLGRDGAAKVITAATERAEANENGLRKHLEKSFFGDHLTTYRKRPIYWYLQSPKKRYGVWIFHERITRDTLYRIQTEYIEPRLRHSENRIKELRDRALLAETRKRRELEKEVSKEADLYDDIQEFHTRLKRIIDRGYTPHFDDGVLLNASPLHEIFPSYPDCAKAWKELMAGKYDWAQQAMEYRPAEVKEACKHNKSYAIAHGLS